MKIVIIGEGMNMPSGFGGQCRVLAEGLHERGHQVTVISSTGNPRKDCPPGLEEWQIADLKNLANLDRVIHRARPDAVIVFWFLHMIVNLTRMRAAPANCPVYIWLPWEGSTLPKNGDLAFRRIPKDRIVHLSEYARDLWGKHANSEVVIPHAYHPDFASVPKVDKHQLRRKWAENLRFPLFDDSIVILNVDRNVRHKRWDATYDFLKRLSARYPNRLVQLIAHTKITDQTTAGTFLQSYDLKQLEAIYQVQNKVAYTDFDWSRGLSRTDLVELFQLADLRITTSEGEGMGLPILESAMCCCPQIVNNHTAVTEILGSDSKFLVDPAGTEFRDVLWQAPNVTEMVDRAVWLLEDDGVRNEQIHAAFTRVRERFSPERIIGQWQELLTAEQDTTQHWYDGRWGYQSFYTNQVAARDLAQTVNRTTPGGRVLEIGSFDGLFTEFAIGVGLQVQGIETDARAIAKASKLAQMYIANLDLGDTWPSADVVVMTDQMEIIARIGGIDAITSVLDRISYHKWAFLRFDPTYLWDVPIYDASNTGTYLESKGMQRRHDLEIMVKGITEMFSHQIWHRGDTSEVPAKIAEAVGAEKK